MQTIVQNIRSIMNLAVFQRVPNSIVIGTAMASIVAVVGLTLMGQPLYIIALFALLPWIPTMLFESLWKIEHYSWIAVFAVFVVLQIGHLGEHVAQVGALSFFDGTSACPPPVDSGDNVTRAIEAGLRDPNSPATSLSASHIIMPDATGIPNLNSSGIAISGPPACGVFGQLDIEVVHLVFELFGWMVTGVLLTKFPRSIWLWIAMSFLVLHTFEHLFISYLYFFDDDLVFSGTKQLWGTVADGNIITAHPLGKEPALVSFYSAAGKFGILARGGLVGTFFPSINSSLLTRPYLHFIYNLLVVGPTVIGFLMVARQAYDKYLAIALPTLTRDELVKVSTQLEPKHYRAGDVIIKQGEIADDFYILAKGTVEVVEETPDGDHVVATLTSGNYFGEIGLRKNAPRTATVRATSFVEVLALDHQEFADLVSGSDLSRDEIDKHVTERVGRIYQQYVSKALPSLSDSELASVTEQLTAEKYNAGQTIIQQGDTAGDFYVVTHGEVEVLEMVADGERRVAILRAGEYFGEIASRQESARTATVRAINNVEVLRLNSEQFEALLNTSELSREEIDKQVATRVAQLVAVSKKAPAL
ncbi:MAG: cyclic nucleotide-binding domain-containing protein [Aggregatilineales bacterium]